MKRRYRLISIVEGHGEFRAIPLLVRRWLEHRHYLNFDVLEPLNTKGKGILKAEPDGNNLRRGIEYWVRRARLAQPDAILVVLDSDADCVQRRDLPMEKQMGPELTARARSVAGVVPVSVVIAAPEYEAWLLHGMTRIRRGMRLSPERRYHSSLAPEGLTGCKRQLGLLLKTGEVHSGYEPAIHQALLSEHLPFTRAMGHRCRSYRKLMKELEYLTTEARRRARALRAQETNGGREMG